MSKNPLPDTSLPESRAIALDIPPVDIPQQLDLGGVNTLVHGADGNVITGTISSLVDKSGDIAHTAATTSRVAAASGVVGIALLGNTVGASEALAHEGGGKTVEVQWGDTLGGIAADEKVPVRTLAEANKINDVNKVRAGTVLTVPEAKVGDGEGPVITVRNGQTLWGMTNGNPELMQATIEANDLEVERRGDKLYVMLRPGQQLIIPAIEPASATEAPRGSLSDQLLASDVHSSVVLPGNTFMSHIAEKLAAVTGKDYKEVLEAIVAENDGPDFILGAKLHMPGFSQEETNRAVESLSPPVPVEAAPAPPAPQVQIATLAEGIINHENIRIPAPEKHLRQTFEGLAQNNAGELPMTPLMLDSLRVLADNGEVVTIRSAKVQPNPGESAPGAVADSNGVNIYIRFSSTDKIARVQKVMAKEAERLGIRDVSHNAGGRYMLIEAANNQNDVEVLAAPTTEQLAITDEMVAIIKSTEGLSLELYNDATGNATIGYGHLVHEGRINRALVPPEFLGGITEERAEQLLREDIARFEAVVKEMVTVPLSQNQYDAIVGFAFNVGPEALRTSTLLHELNHGNYDAVPGELMKWVHGDGEVLGGLVKKRQHEVARWNSSGYAVPAPAEELDVELPELAQALVEAVPPVTEAIDQAVDPVAAAPGQVLEQVAEVVQEVLPPAPEPEQPQEVAPLSPLQQSNLEQLSNPQLDPALVSTFTEVNKFYQFEVTDTTRIDPNSHHHYGDAVDVGGRQGINGESFGYQGHSPTVEQFIKDVIDRMPQGTCLEVGVPNSHYVEHIKKHAPHCEVFVDQGSGPHLHFAIRS